LPVSDDTPRQGVPKGPRMVQWQPLADAKLIWAEALDGGQPVSRALTAPVDKTRIKAAVDDLRRAGVEVFLLGLGENDPLGLEALRDAGGKAVLADWQVSGAFPSQVLMSVEEDVPGGITRALDALRAGASLVQGPVRLVSGKKI